MPLSRFRAGFRLALLCGAASARADDAVGILRVDVASNETVAVAVPFEPLAVAGQVSDFLSGDFAGANKPFAATPLATIASGRIVTSTSTGIVPG